MAEPTPFPERPMTARGQTEARRAALADMLAKARQVDDKVRETAGGEETTSLDLLLAVISRLRVDTIMSLALIHAEVHQLSAILLEEDE